MGTIFVIFLLFAAGWGLDIKDIVVIILSQANEHHSRIANDMKKNLHEQAELLQKGKPVVHLSHKDFPHVGDWTVLPLIPQLYDLHGTNASWLLFVEDRTEIVLKNLHAALGSYTTDKPVWLGHALHDVEATIIHHFAFYDNPEIFKYPNMASGIAINAPLLQRLNERLTRHKPPHSDFGIDSGHELALFIWDKGNGEVLTNDLHFCSEEREHCATFPAAFRQCGELQPKNSLYFAVKTCSMYHRSRIPVVKSTWAKHVDKIEYFSDVVDGSIPTLDLGVPNTENGHCAKTLAILKHARGVLEREPRLQWVVLADDDTILGVSRLQQLLTCYNATHPVALGERYGYNVYSNDGYNYITGGGGLVFSKTLLKELTRGGVCECPTINAPDDMFLGLCIANLGLSVTHSPLFHQARPVDYPQQYLKTQDAVSFHKHWMIDPVNVYHKWFAEDDVKVGNVMHGEL